ncbi:MAG: hypothetical protein RL117_320 [Verrucomicrobiota bacterium]|jgi:hypothetical protein
MPFMNPLHYIAAFAWIALIALACSVLAEFWLAMIAGALLAVLLVRMAIPAR